MRLALGVMDNFYQFRDFDTVGKLCLKMVLQCWAIDLCSSCVPLATPTRIYMSGSCRSWIHYIHLRSAHGTQKEHKLIAQNCKTIFKKSFPIVSKSLEW